MRFCHSNMKTPTLLLITLTTLFAIPSAFAQRGNTDHREVHRAINKFEADLLQCLDAKAELYANWSKRNEELKQLHAEHNKAEGANKERLGQRIDTLNNQTRAATIALGNIDLEIEKIKLEIDRLTRYDEHIIANEKDHDDHGHQPKRLRVKAIRNLTFKREGPVRQSGRLGFVDTNVWEITFNDDSTQRLEDKEFVPIR